jgi:YVTN family beta-propeller protein
MKLQSPRLVLVTLIGAGMVVCSVLGTRANEAQSTAANGIPFRSPQFLVVAKDGQAVYVSDRTARAVVALHGPELTQTHEIRLQGEPHGITLSADGHYLFVAEYGAGTVAIVDTAQHAVISRVTVGKWPMSIALAEPSRRLYVGNQDDHTVSVIDLGQEPPREIERVAVTREPSAIAVTPDQQRVIVANRLPHCRGTDNVLASEISIIDATALSVATQIQLPSGSTMVNGLCLSPDGAWAYVVHGLGRFNLPITQLERGWVNTNALTIIDLANNCRFVTLLLDELSQGAADPHSIVCSSDGSQLWISHAGVHELSLIDVRQLHRLLAGEVPADLATLKDGMRPNVWVEIQEDKTKMSKLENNLTALYIAGVIRRFPSGGKGPRGLAMTPQGDEIFAANYYSGEIAVLAADTGILRRTIAVGSQPEATAERRGELIFHDATYAFQRWHSCASCHANEGRVDGLRWDFLADGIGNGKDTLSLVGLQHTEPMNRRATVATAAACTRGGLESTNMLVPTDEAVADLYAYLTSLTPLPNPHRQPDGTLSQVAQRGQDLFQGKAKCANCHPAPYFTDKRVHNVGVLSPNEPDGRYDTPSLVEAYRTAPYLHDGRALTLKEVLTTHNKEHKHGGTEGLSVDEIDAIVAFLREL